MRSVYRVMFVCHGNICRSPMAEMIFKKMLADRGISDNFAVSSSATSTEAIGEGIYPPARRELARRGIPIEERRARRLRAADYAECDLLVGMDGRNVRNMHLMLGGDPYRKIVRLLDLTECSGDVADPWYTGDFALAFDDISRGCEALLEYVMGL